jgi:hypothetical protein
MPTRRAMRRRLGRSEAQTVIPLTNSMNLQTAGFLSLIFVLTNLARGEYSIERCLSQTPHLQRRATLWLMAWAVALLVGFATKTTQDFSRVASVAFFLAVTSSS